VTGVELVTTAIADPACQVDDGEKKLRCALERANEQLLYESMQSDFAALFVHGNAAYMARTGEMQIIYTLGDEAFDMYEKPSEPLGGIRWTGMIKQLPLFRTSAILVANRGVLDNAGMPAIRTELTKAAPDKAALETAVKKLVAHPALAQAGAGATSGIIVRAVAKR
jgi:hypothetical protein